MLRCVHNVIAQANNLQLADIIEVADTTHLRDDSRVLLVLCQLAINLLCDLGEWCRGILVPEKVLCLDIVFFLHLAAVLLSLLQMKRSRLDCFLESNSHLTAQLIKQPLPGQQSRSTSYP